MWFTSLRQAPHNACVCLIKHTQHNNTRFFISIWNNVNWMSLKSLTRYGKHHHTKYNQNMTTAKFKIIYLLFYFLQFKEWILLKIPFVGALSIPGHLSFAHSPCEFCGVIVPYEFTIFKLTSRWWKTYWCSIWLESSQEILFLILAYFSVFRAAKVFNVCQFSIPLLQSWSSVHYWRTTPCFRTQYAILPHFPPWITCQGITKETHYQKHKLHCMVQLTASR